MNDRTDPPGERDGRNDRDIGPDTLSPLPGEPGIPDVAQRRGSLSRLSRKGLLAVGLLLLLVVAVVAVSIQRFAASGAPDQDDTSQRVADRPTAASKSPRRLELPAAVAASAPSTTVRIPALVPTAEEVPEPIGVRRTGSGPQGSTGRKAVSPQDAPVLLVSSRPGARTTPGNPSAAPDGNGETHPADPLSATTRNLEDYQRQLQGLLETMTRTVSETTGRATGSFPAGALLGGGSTGSTVAGLAPAAGAGLFGGQLQGSSTPRVAASTLGDRSLTLPKGTAFTCALKTKVISATSGLVGCQVQRNVYGDDGRVLLIERGSHLDGEYRIASVRPGMVRIPVLWTRVRTPLGVTVDLASPGTGQLGESGVDGHVDNRWGERIGAAMLLSLIDDSVKLVIQNQASDRQADTIVLPSTTANTSKLAEKVLDSTINIPPLIYRNQGGIVGIYVARDVDFSSVYELKPTTLDPPAEAAR
jgi:type IV secretion system protein VirB10